MTPLALADHLNPELPGFGEWLRSESAVYTKTAWLSRMGGGLIGRALVITLPGSLQAVKECFGIFIEGLPKAIVMMKNKGAKGGCDVNYGTLFGYVSGSRGQLRGRR